MTMGLRLREIILGQFGNGGPGRRNFRGRNERRYLGLGRVHVHRDSENNNTKSDVPALLSRFEPECQTELM